MTVFVFGFNFSATTQTINTKKELVNRGFGCQLFNLPYRQGKFFAVENKVIILSGVTTYSLSKTNRNQTREFTQRDQGISSDTSGHIF